MTAPCPALRFYESAQRVARKQWHEDNTPELLLRVGFPGLMTRLGYSRVVHSDEAFWRLQKLYHTLLLESAQEVTHKLTGAGIPHFFAKGIALLGEYYQPGDRSMSDMDVYVPMDARDSALTVLRQTGYADLPEEDQAGPTELRTALALARESAPEVQQHMVDLHWSLDPVERILPRRSREIPEPFWRDISFDGAVPAPSPEHHAALLAHHLVHTDLLHIRNLLDLVYVFSTFSENGGADFLNSCNELRIGTFASAIARIMERDFAVSRPAAMGAGSARVRKLVDSLSLDRWLEITAQSHPHDDEVITVPRILRRLRLVDAGGARTLFADLFFPPASFLEWRWSGLGRAAAVRMHYAQLLRKAWRW